MKSVKKNANLPTFTVFRNLPIVQALQNKNSQTTTTIDVGKELLGSSTLQTLLQDNLANWTEQVKEKFAAILACPPFVPVSEKKLHPSDRLTARLLCSICLKKKSGRVASLDLKEARAHRCKNMTKKQKARYMWKVESFIADTKVS